MDKRPAIQVAVILSIILLAFASCVWLSCSEPSIVREIKADLTGVKSEITGVKKTVGDIKVTGNYNDTWTLRLSVVSLALTPLLGYIFPKLVWCWVQQRTLRARRSRPRDRSPPP